MGPTTSGEPPLQSRGSSRSFLNPLVIVLCPAVHAPQWGGGGGGGRGGAGGGGGGARGGGWWMTGYKTTLDVYSTSLLHSCLHTNPTVLKIVTRIVQLCVNISHCCQACDKGVLFLVRFNNFGWTMGFYWSYTLLL